MTALDERPWAAEVSLKRMITELAGIKEDLSSGACRGRDPELFYAAEDDAGGASRSRIQAAKAICAACPIRTTCLAGAMERLEPFGIWGGLTTKERRALRRATPAPERFVSKFSRNTDEENAYRLDLYQQGLTDNEIAATEGVSRNAITSWRTRKGLRLNAAAGDAAMHERRLKMYRAGWSDQQIADAEGLTLLGAKGWRKGQKLPVNK